MPGITYHWLSNQQIEPLSTADIILATVLSITVLAGIALCIWYAVKEL